MTANPICSVLFIGNPGVNEQQVIAGLNQDDNFELIGYLHTLDRLAREVIALNPHLILIENEINGESTIDVVEDLSAQFPDVPIIVILPTEDTADAQRATLAGARAFIIQPFTQINLLATIRRVWMLELNRQKAAAQSVVLPKQSKRKLKSMLVFSPRGGVGTSTTSANLAIAIKQQTNQSLMLLEGKLFFGHLGMLLNLREQASITDLLHHSANLDDDLIRDVALHHASGISVLLCPSDIETAQGVRPDQLYNVLMGLTRVYDYLVIDGGSQLTENTVTLMDSSDRIALVITPDLAAVHDASRFIHVSRNLGYPTEKILVILNRAGMKGGIRQKDIEAALRLPIFMSIPDAPFDITRSINSGVPLVLRHPRNKVSKTYKLLAQKLVEEDVSVTGSLELTRGSARTPNQEVLIASSRFG